MDRPIIIKAQKLNPWRINVALEKSDAKGCESLPEPKFCSLPNEWVFLENSSSCTDYADTEEAFESGYSNKSFFTRIRNKLVRKSASLARNKLVECPSKNRDGDSVSSDNSELAKKSDEDQRVKCPNCPRDPAGDCSKNCDVAPLPQHYARRLFNCRFLLDLNDSKFTTVAPNEKFSKKLRLFNNGSRPWSRKSKLVWVDGDRLTDEISIEIEIPFNGRPIGSEIDLVVNFRAPELPGDYISFWNMSLPSGAAFGEQIPIRIWVYDLPKIT
ncbi:hypothetical protein ABFS83_11G059400 [Erythranthe nasuta]